MGYLLFAVLLSVIGVTLVSWWNHRTVSMESGMKEFSRGLRALAPDALAQYDDTDGASGSDDASSSFTADRDDERERGTG